MAVVTRFAPSPTGMLHIGGARTALFCWLFARRHGGEFLLRIEDTDRERSTEAATEAIYRDLKWLGLDWDGEPVSQAACQARHREVVEQLLAEGKAYKCYCTPEELEQMREDAKKEGRAVAYDRRWRDSTQPPPAGVEPVIRIKAPLDGDMTIQDVVQGDVTVAASQLDDFVLLRSDGTPTYMLAVVVDDHDMGITHIIRGDDHLSNAFRQKIIYDALGWNMPVLAHVPLIHGADGAKLSKRHGAVGAQEFRDLGYLPEAMRNYLLRLGWSHGDDELISDDQAREWFDLEHIHRAPAKLDMDKLNHVNAHYLRAADNARLLDLMTPFLSRAPNNTESGWIFSCMDELKDRAQTLKDLAAAAEFLLKEKPLQPDDKAAGVLNDEARKVLAGLKEKLESLDTFKADAIQGVIKDFANDNGLKMGQVAMPFRAAITGTTQTPSIFHIAEIFGREETLSRLTDVTG